jgi:large subunit ribosomal protein L3
MKEILGKKIGMTRVFGDSGEALSVTVIQAGPCPVVAVKTKDKDGYDAYQIGFGERRKSRTNKPRAGHFAKAKVDPKQYLREVRFDGELGVGDEIKVNAFNEGDWVDVTGVSRGLGFAGVMKRHHFSGGQATHGQSDRLRAPGSIGQSSYPSRVFKGMKMPGRMGKDTVTVLKLEVVKIIEAQNLMLVKGAVPGSKGSLVKVRTSNRSR